MKFAVMSFNTEYSIRADDLARAVEERGLESVWFPEHTHIPASRRTPYPGGGELHTIALHCCMHRFAHHVVHQSIVTWLCSLPALAHLS